MTKRALFASAPAPQAVWRRIFLLYCAALAAKNVHADTSLASYTCSGRAASDERDDTCAINSLLITAKRAKTKTLDLNGRALTIRGRLIVDSVVLRNFSAIFNGHSASILLTGTAPGVHDYYIDHGDSGPLFGKADSGVFNLHLSRDAVIGSGKVTGRSRRAAVSCSTRADRTVIDGLEASTAWGIVFNDQSSRVFNDYDYSDVPIGAGLDVRNCHFNGHAPGSASGDGIEINTPRHGFASIVVENCAVSRTISSPSVGIGIGFANVRDAVITDCTVANCTSPAGAFHAEWSDNVLFQRCTATECLVGVSVSMAYRVAIRECKFDRSRLNAIQSFNQFPRDTKRTDAGRETALLIVEDCVFVAPEAGGGGRGGVDLVVARVAELRFNRNILFLPQTVDAPRLVIRAFLGRAVDRLVIKGNKFVGVPIATAGLASVAPPLRSLDISGNLFEAEFLRDSFETSFPAPSR